MSLPILPTSVLTAIAVACAGILLAGGILAVVFARPERIQRLEHARPQQVLLWWLGVILPWGIVSTYAVMHDAISFALTGGWTLLLAGVVLAAVTILLLMLPIAVVAATIVWLRARREEVEG